MYFLRCGFYLISVKSGILKVSRVGYTNIVYLKIILEYRRRLKFNVIS